MARNRLAVYEIWDVTSPVVPPRSRFYHLVPIGVGTPYVESLTGYVARLAETHNVHTRALVAREVLPLLGRWHLSKPGNNSLASFWVKDSRALNGTRTLARDWGRALEQLTLRDDLRFTTLLTWAGVLTCRGLLRPNRAWCPVCYEEWHAAGQVVYEPLLWALQVTVICPRHRRPLSSQCPHPDCAQHQSLLGPRSRPGYCSECGRWLGAQAEASPIDSPSLAEDQWTWQMWVTESVGAMLAAAPSLTMAPAKERFATALSMYLERVAEGSAAAVSRELGLSRDAVRRWQRKGQLPRLELLLRLCYCFGTSPLRFLTEELGVVSPTQMNSPMTNEPVARPRPVRHLDAEAVRCALQAVLAGDEQPPPPMREIANRLGYAASFLHPRFPDLCRAISARYKAYRAACGQAKMQQLRDEVRQAVLRVHAQNVYPSASRTAALLEKPGAIRHSEAQAAWRETLRELGWMS